MNVLIVGRTQMGPDRRCIGGLAANGHSVRLMAAPGEHWTTAAPFQVGEVWEIDFTPVANVVPPHFEDVLVTAHQRVGVQPDVRGHGHLLSRLHTPWRGGIGQLFGGVVGYTSNDNGYVCARLGVPDHSTGYWIPDRDLALRADGRHYDYPVSAYSKHGMVYVGEPAAPVVLPAGTLIRVSLARWWKPDDVDIEERCYLQLSGWYV